jgi:hypothetical protein
MKPEETTPENTTPTDEAEIIATELEKYFSRRGPPGHSILLLIGESRLNPKTLT